MGDSVILICVSPYRGTINQLTGEVGAYRVREEINVADEVAEYLLRDSPGSFVRESDFVPDAIAEAPNRMAKGGRKR